MGKGQAPSSTAMEFSAAASKHTVSDGDLSDVLQQLKQMPGPTVIIMRGLPGSGKSTAAGHIAELFDAEVHATDSFFFKDGEYFFDPSKLKEFHALNQAAFQQSLEEGKAMVICDNTNTQRWEFEPYLAAANQHGYQPIIVEIVADPEEAAARCSHGVPLEAVRRMQARWEA
jgi:predicted kinase